MNKPVNQETIVNHLKKHGFFYQNSAIYNGLANAWDYGHLGVLLKNNLKKLLLKHFVDQEPNYFLLDTNIILHPQVWNTSGHVKNFHDPLVDCKNCQHRYRADKLISAQFTIYTIDENTPLAKLNEILSNHKVICPNCQQTNWTEVRLFNLMFATNLGSIGQNSQNHVYLRPETAQGIFINFSNIWRTHRPKLPFAVVQFGKAFRNEITPGNFLYRTYEFEQMEIELFTAPETSQKEFQAFLAKIKSFLIDVLHLDSANVQQHNHSQEELAFYASQTTDFLYHFPHGFNELWGIANRQDYDLKQHMTATGVDLTYLDPHNNSKFIPHVIEPSVGIDRLIYAILVDAYKEVGASDEQRVILKLAPELVPYQAAVLPLVQKLNSEAYDLFLKLKKTGWRVNFANKGSIGKRYYNQDAMGTLFCITYDFDSLTTEMITVRDRNTGKQIKIPVTALDWNALLQTFGY